jgi:uncharacterized cupredoxin-like copper-binding protein
MRRLLPPVLALALLVAGAAPATAGTEAESFVQVVEKEWSLVMSRTSVRAGRVTIEAVNFGTDAHDLVVQSKAKGSKPVKFKQMDPRGRTERTLRLPAGRYALWCSLPGHKAKGMKATLTVRA